MPDLTTLPAVKEWLQTGQQPFPPTDDALLSRLITACSSYIEDWLSRPVGLANWREVRSGAGGERANLLPLAMTPVVAVLAVTIDGLAIQQAAAFSQAGWSFTPSAVLLSGYRFARGAGNIVVDYTAGYDPIPADIEQVCVEMVARKYRERTRIGEVSRSLGGAETVSYDTKMFSMHDRSDIQTLLAQYRQSALLQRPTLLPPPPAQLVLEDATTAIDLEDGTPILAEQ